ncbi:MAG TPA: alpha-glucan family phosphorylase [Noviherbaspirillum sp.]|uniref:alpha-glucan family phosphorylase n=1 Tax=Noviherbaspirillum sp. TaxID=1926288 RepID=UPI002F933783
MTITPLDEFLQVSRVAYFSMEIALESAIPTYSGGLGVLAGDTMRSAADLDLPLVGVTLVSRAGYFTQEITDAGRQVEHESAWDPSRHALPLPAKVALEIEGRQVWLTAWLYVIRSQVGGKVPVLLLDADLPENSPEDRRLTHHLYGGDSTYRLKQEMLLGPGGMRLLRALGFSVQRYHLNEGHAALLCLDLLRRSNGTGARPAAAIAAAAAYNVGAVRSQCVFTTHTPVEAGHDKFSYELVSRVLGPNTDIDLLRELGGAQHLNLTQIALNLSEYVNGVAKSHAELSRRMFPGYQVHAIGNGVHPYTWAADSIRRLYDSQFPHWCNEPETLMRIDQVDGEALWSAHLEAKHALLAHVRQSRGVTLRPDVMTICFARRMTGYKRPDLLFTDLGRLREMARRHPLQLVIAGKAHPHDADGKRLIEALHRYLGELGEAVRGVFLPGYDMDLARLLVSGADVWLNTPLPPMEASGTSGMKAALNGVPSLSVLDGWWMEGCIEGVTGWGIGQATAGEDPRSHAWELYDKLESVVLPLFYGSREGWLQMMKGAIGRNAVLFNTHRTMRRYAAEAYLRTRL